MVDEFGSSERKEVATQSQIRRFLDEVKEINLGFENYKKTFDRVKSSDEIITSQIQNLVREYTEIKEQYDEYTKKDEFQNMLDDGIVRVELYHIMRDMNKRLVEAYTWKSIQEEIYTVVFSKITQVLDDARALDIKRDALKEMREMDEKRNALFMEMFREMSELFKGRVDAKLNSYDEKFMNIISFMDEQNKKHHSLLIRTITEVIGKDFNLKIDEVNSIAEKIKVIDEDLSKKMLEESEKRKEEFQRRERPKNVAKAPPPQVFSGKVSKTDDINDSYKDFDNGDDDESVIDDDDYDDDSEEKPEFEGMESKGVL